MMCGFERLHVRSHGGQCMVRSRSESRSRSRRSGSMAGAKGDSPAGPPRLDRVGGRPFLELGATVVTPAVEVRQAVELVALAVMGRRCGRGSWGGGLSGSRLRQDGWHGAVEYVQADIGFNQYLTLYTCMTMQLYRYMMYMMLTNFQITTYWQIENACLTQV